MDESTKEQLEDALRAAIDACDQANDRLMHFLAKLPATAQERAEFKKAIDADGDALRALDRAREAYDAATNPGTAFSSL
jgi:hypothetical protein